jgi:PAS domain S-box-containing protein
LANNLAFGVMALRTRKERTRAENEIRQLNASLEKRVAKRTIELARSEEKFRALFEGTSQAVVLHDEHGILEANPSWLRLLGYSSLADVIGKHAIELSAPIQPSGERAEILATRHIANAFASGSERFEWTILRRDGTELPMEVFLTIHSQKHAPDGRDNGRSASDGKLRCGQDGIQAGDAGAADFLASPCG